MAARTITFVRHGNTDANNERWLQGQTDTVLNEKGLEQAALVGQRLQSEAFDVLYCSDLVRCKQTLEGIRQYHSATIPIIYKTGLRERSFGSLSGNPVGFLESESTRLSIGVDQLVKQSGGESEKEFGARVVEAYRDIVNETSAHGHKNTLVVTHGGPLHILAYYWIKVAGFRLRTESTQSMFRHGNTAVTRISIDPSGEGGLIEFINSTTHLGETQESDAPIAV